jgi:hypothetical protein
LNVRIPVILEDAGLLAAFTHPSHIDNYVPGDSFSCRLPASSMILGIPFILEDAGLLPSLARWRSRFARSAPTRIFNDFGYTSTFLKAGKQFFSA